MQKPAAPDPQTKPLCRLLHASRLAAVLVASSVTKNSPSGYIASSATRPDTRPFGAEFPRHPALSRAAWRCPRRPSRGRSPSVQDAIGGPRHRRGLRPAQPMPRGLQSDNILCRSTPDKRRHIQGPTALLPLPSSHSSTEGWLLFPLPVRLCAATVAAVAVVSPKPCPYSSSAPVNLVPRAGKCPFSNGRRVGRQAHVIPEHSSPMPQAEVLMRSTEIATVKKPRPKMANSSSLCCRGRLSRFRSEKGITSTARSETMLPAVLI